MNKDAPNSKKYGPPVGYYENTKNRPAHELLREALQYVADDSRRAALDFGCGAGADTRFLLENGFTVDAVDGSSEAEKYIKSLPHQERVKFILSEFENFNFGSYNLVNASRSLPFAHKDTFSDIFSKLKQSIISEGVFVGQFYGVNDQWNKPNETMTFLNKKETEEFLEGMKILKLKEQEYDGEIANGKPKHWHIFSVIARKT